MPDVETDQICTFNDSKAGDGTGKARQKRGDREEEDRMRERVRRTQMSEPPISTFQGEETHL